MIRVYLAAQYALKERMKSYRADLRSRGFDVTSRWLNNSPGTLEAVVEAEKDKQDVDYCDWFILFSEDENYDSTKGGKHWETGYAYAKGKKIYLIGDTEHVFHMLPSVERYESWDKFLSVVDERLAVPI